MNIGETPGQGIIPFTQVEAILRRVFTGGAA
jgi:hypothetical protein